MEFLAKAATIATIAYAYFFLLGWMTLAYYYGAFEIDLSALDLLPSYIFPAFSFFPIFLSLYWLWICLAIVLIVAAVLVVVGRRFGGGQPNFHAPDRLVVLLGAVILALPFVAAPFLGKGAARDALTLANVS